MNEEGTSETVSLNDKFDDELLNWKVSTLKLLDRNDDVSPVSSRYSSCGESEFDRYCSANSVMGTPSVCGSSVGTFHDFPDSDIGSVKSSRLGDVGGLENFSLGGKFENKNSLSLGRLGEYSHKNIKNLEQRSVVPENEMNSYDEMEAAFSDLPDEGGVVMWKDDINSKRMESTSTNNVFEKNLSAEKMEEGSEGVDQVNDVFEDGKKLDECSEGETSSRLEHSESDGSMYGYGTDNEEMGRLPPRGYTDYSQDEKNINEKTLFMASSVAYGSEDWDDFMQGTKENAQDLFVIDESQGLDGNELGIEGRTFTSTFVSKSIDVSEKQENVKDFDMNKEIGGAHDVPTYSKTHEEDMKDKFVIGKQVEDSNPLKMEVAPLMNAQPTKLEHTNSNGTTDNLTNSNGPVQSTLTQDAEDQVAEMPNDHKPYTSPSLPNVNVEKRQNATPVSLNIPKDPQVASKVSY